MKSATIIMMITIITINENPVTPLVGQFRM